MAAEHIGSSFDDFLSEEGILEEVEAVALHHVRHRLRALAARATHSSAEKTLRRGKGRKGRGKPQTKRRGKPHRTFCQHSGFTRTTRSGRANYACSW